MSTQYEIAMQLIEHGKEMKSIEGRMKFAQVAASMLGLKVPLIDGWPDFTSLKNAAAYLKDAPPEAFPSKGAEPPHPVQPLVRGLDGTVSFKANPIVRFLINAGKFDWNVLGLMPWQREDMVQLIQFSGMSLIGFGSSPYVTDEDYNRAESQEIS